MSDLVAFLRHTDRPMPGYVWRAAVLSVVPSLFIAAVILLGFNVEAPGLEGPGPALVDVFGVLLFSPWIETLLMWPILSMLKRFIEKDLGVAAASAVVWGLLHSAMAPAWGLITAWSFFVLSMAFLSWQKKSTGRAIVATACIHMAHNLIPAIAIALP